MASNKPRADERAPLTAHVDGRSYAAVAAAPPAEEVRRRSEHHNLAGLPAWRFRLACLAIWSATFLAAFDGTVVATLLSSIGSSFNALNQASWLGTAYLLSLCSFTPVYGRLSDALGRRNALLVALGSFTLGTAVCAVAPSMGALIAARVLAGVGGGGLTSVGSILISDLVDLRHRGLYQGYANVLFGLGASLGGPVGGWCADTFGWRVAFSAQLPLLVASVLAIIAFVPSTLGAGGGEGSWSDKLRKIDYAGSTLLAAAIGSLLLGVSLKTAASKPGGGEYAWSDPLVAGLLVASLVVTAVFLVVEGKYAAEPVLPLGLLSRRTPASVAFSNLTMAACIFSMLYNVPLFFTAVRLQSSSVAGAHLLPYSVLIGFGSLAIGYVMRRSGRYYPAMMFSAVLIVASCALMLTWTTSVPEWLTWLAPTPAGFGYAGALTSTLVALMAEVTKNGRSEIAVATSMTYMFRTVGQVLGVALSAAILQATLEADLTAQLSDRTLIDAIRHSSDIIPGLPGHVRRIAVDAYAHGLHRVWQFNLALAILTVAIMAVADNDHIPEAPGGAQDDAADE
ncbi:hypothetical protein Q8F55_006220 [Vanrija albida]|uniref:Major facilitator superfamily (MFS) profile domain-containing protein n=1 Tax=Vanrija albida TaxID=181172 RepID=A0ABR3PWI9_9TREE